MGKLSHGRRKKTCVITSKILQESDNKLCAFVPRKANSSGLNVV